MSVSDSSPEPRLSTESYQPAQAEKYPRILGPLKFGVRPSSPVLYQIPHLGSAGVRFHAEGLPEGVHLDPESGLLGGKAPHRESTHTVALTIEDKLGRHASSLDLVIGRDITLTPPMGWNSWNCWGTTITQEKIRRTAHAIVRHGLHRYGWSFVNIDDGWQGKRDSRGRLQPNEKFSDMKGLCDEIHELGLKAGIYSTPWVRSFGDHTGGSSGRPRAHIRDEDKEWYVGEVTYEREDAAQWAEWGFDFLKYDWHPVDLASGRRMREALLASGRDVVFNVTNAAYQEDSAKWAEICECFFLWRTLEDRDICDTWESVSSIGFRMHQWRKYVRPGHWNDPDMLVIGAVGWNDKPTMTRLTADEQYMHVSLWCLLAAPLFLGCDLDQLDEFTWNLITNEEVLAINQDVLGDMARPVVPQPDEEVWFKRMHDGSIAVGLFNKSDEVSRRINVTWLDLGLKGACVVRNVWEREDLGTYQESFQTDVPRHGVCLIRITPV